MTKKCDETLKKLISIIPNKITDHTTKNTEPTKSEPMGYKYSPIGKKAKQNVSEGSKNTCYGRKALMSTTTGTSMYNTKPLTRKELIEKAKKATTGVNSSGKLTDKQLQRFIHYYYWDGTSDKVEEPPHVCPLCGNKGYNLVFAFYCTSEDCKNYHKEDKGQK